MNVERVGDVLARNKNGRIVEVMTSLPPGKYYYSDIDVSNPVLIYNVSNRTKLYVKYAQQHRNKPGVILLDDELKTPERSNPAYDQAGSLWRCYGRTTNNDLEQAGIPLGFDEGILRITGRPENPERSGIDGPGTSQHAGEREGGSRRTGRHDVSRDSGQAGPSGIDGPGILKHAEEREGSSCYRTGRRITLWDCEQAGPSRDFDGEGTSQDTRELEGPLRFAPIKMSPSSDTTEVSEIPRNTFPDSHGKSSPLLYNHGQTRSSQGPHEGRGTSQSINVKTEPDFLWEMVEREGRTHGEVSANFQGPVHRWPEHDARGPFWREINLSPLQETRVRASPDRETRVRVSPKRIRLNLKTAPPAQESRLGGTHGGAVTSWETHELDQNADPKKSDEPPSNLDGNRQLSPTTPQGPEQKIEKNTKYLCSKCPAMCRNFERLIAHESKHFQCHICRKVFSSGQNVEDHQQTHMHLGVTCRICKKKFQRQISLSRHIKLYHKGKF